MESLSARRAWIEITHNQHPLKKPLVALRKESVDRNALFALLCNLLHESLSARRAWIEIDDMSGATERIFVALRKESVDRNTLVLTLAA